MNKRQIKKKYKLINQRFDFFNKHIIGLGRQNGKTLFVRVIYKACLSKKYKYFKELKLVEFDGFRSKRRTINFD